MAQPVLTYNLTWGTGNVYQKLSGKTYITPSGSTIDCSSVTVTFSSSKHFKKFYATAVKSGNDYGFDNDILVDIRQTNPTGILLYELTERNANTNFNFTINSSSLTAGSGEYRIGLYVQDDDGIWNYEYFLLTSENEQIESSDNLLLQVPVTADFVYYSGPPEGCYPLCVDLKNQILFLYDPDAYRVVESRGIHYDRQIFNFQKFGSNVMNWSSIYNRCYYMDTKTFMQIGSISSGQNMKYDVSIFKDQEVIFSLNDFCSTVGQSRVGPTIISYFQ